ncbi:MAG: hypothetical protein OXG38_05610, partial [Chloroflexi bacterium]|nr:hypothetical protein [Chloroflexota bacterium]
LLRYALGARRFAGAPAELARREPPAAPPPAEREAGPRRLPTRRVLLRSRKRKEGERRTGRLPFRPHRLFGKRRRLDGEEAEAGRRAATRERSERRPGRWRVLPVLAALAVVLAALPPTTALAQEPGGEGWSSDEIEFQPPPPVPGRRIFVEGLTVRGERAGVALRAATDLRLTVRAFGGPTGRTLRSYLTASLEQGERVRYDLPLHGPAPSLVFSWEDDLGQAGAVSLDGERLPYPLPKAAGELCALRVVALGWSADTVEGAVASRCASATRETVPLQTVAGHADVTATALLAAEVVAVSGTVTVASGGARTAVAFVAGSETRFRLPLAAGEGVHTLAIKARLEASLRVALPPLVQLTHRPRRVERRTETVLLTRPGIDETVSETVTLAGEDGTPVEHTVSAHFSIPSETVHHEVVLSVVHPERIEAEVVARSPIERSRHETLALASSVGADEPYRALTVPEPEPEPARPASDQTPATGGELSDWFERLGWEWIW